MLINLRDPDATFAQGDEIAGSVIYPDAHPATPFRLVVEFVGIVKTKAGDESGSSYETVHEEAEIVRLLVSDTEWNATVFPFSFCFPWSAPPLEGHPTPTTGQSEKKRLPDPLPPSHEIHGGFDKKLLRMWVGSIGYKVRATIFLQNARNPLQQEMAINYRPVLDSQSSYEQEDWSDYNTDCVKDIYVKSLLLLPQNKDRKLTFGERTKSLFQRSSLPNFNFKVIVTHPTRINLGQPLHFVVKLELSPDTPTAPEIPEITLVYFGHMVTGNSEVWAKSSKNVIAPEMEPVFCSLNKKMGPFCPSRGYAKTFMTPALTHAVPNFQTKNVSRSYSIMSVVRVECAGKTFSWENKSDFTVLPAMRGVVLPEEPLLKWSLTNQPPVEWREGDVTQKHWGVPSEQPPVKLGEGDETRKHQGFPLKP